MPIPEAYREVVGMVIERTAAGDLDWRELRSDDYVVSFDDFSFNIWSWHDENTGRFEGYSAGLVNEKGELIDSFLVTTQDPHYDLLEDLFGAARRKARRVDEALAKIRAALTSAKPKRP